ncbi:MAG: YraN family protein [Candidatus Doudnabacteria bacterium]|nr:YraN family protein [Candidatus Doudnabacteria bacterium]
MLNLFRKKSTSVEKPKTLGQLGEEFAQTVYLQNGFKIIGANVFNTKGLRRGEIDFVASNKQKIIFVEVKTRSGGSRFGSAEESVNFFKQQKILKAVKWYLLANPEYVKLIPQIDVCIVEHGLVDKTFNCAKIISNAVEDINSG